MSRKTPHIIAYHATAQHISDIRGFYVPSQAHTSSDAAQLKGNLSLRDRQTTPTANQNRLSSLMLIASRRRSTSGGATTMTSHNRLSAFMLVASDAVPARSADDRAGHNRLSAFMLVARYHILSQ